MIISSADLELEDLESEGVSKRVSALTPTVLESEALVLFPFVSLKMGGGYAYGHEYVISETGAVDVANPDRGLFDAPYEEKLNGRDDYGLLYYTIIGTREFSGYPTFLIILENLGDRKRVHFHRVSPCRYEYGKPTLTTKLVERCYQYMAGNLPASDVDFQQGDLIFVREKEAVFDLNEFELVDQYEGHCFSPPILYRASQIKKDNLLGTIVARGEWELKHQEHSDYKLSAGAWKVYRCKSFERNPAGSFRKFRD